MIAERGTEARDAAPLQIGGGQGAKNWLACRKELARPRNAFAGGSIVALSPLGFTSYGRAGGLAEKGPGLP